MDIVGFMDQSFIACYDGIRVIVPLVEASWLRIPSPETCPILQSKRQLIVLEVVEEDRVLMGSIRQCEPDPWTQIHQRFPKGMELTGTVSKVTPEWVEVELPDGFFGMIPKEAMIEGGYEYADFGDLLSMGSESI